MRVAEKDYKLDWHKQFDIQLVEVDRGYIFIGGKNHVPFEHGFAINLCNLGFASAVYQRNHAIPEWLTLLEKVHFVYGDAILDLPGISFKGEVEAIFPKLGKEYTDRLDFKVSEKVDRAYNEKKTPVLIRRIGWEFRKDLDVSEAFLGKDRYYVYGRFTTGVI